MANLFNDANAPETELATIFAGDQVKWKHNDLSTDYSPSHIGAAAGAICENRDKPGYGSPYRAWGPRVKRCDAVTPCDTFSYSNPMAEIQSQKRIQNAVTVVTLAHILWSQLLGFVATTPKGD